MWLCQVQRAQRCTGTLRGEGPVEGDGGRAAGPEPPGPGHRWPDPGEFWGSSWGLGLEAGVNNW